MRRVVCFIAYVLALILFCIIYVVTFIPAMIALGLRKIMEKYS